MRKGSDNERGRCGRKQCEMVVKVGQRRQHATAVIPAQAGIDFRSLGLYMDSRLRGNELLAGSRPGRRTTWREDAF
jgi:hypothetical protein